MSRLWTRRALADWLGEVLNDGLATLVGIDHGFSFPWAYFERYGIPTNPESSDLETRSAFRYGNRCFRANWVAFLEDFHRHWPTDEAGVSVDLIREGRHGNGAARRGDARWRRLTEQRGRAKSVFHFDVPGSVAKSTHAGLPWLRILRHRWRVPVHFWPFDGWLPAEGSSMVAEVYPSLWSKNYPAGKRTPDQHDAYSSARWMRETDSAGYWEEFLHPLLSASERPQAEVEGWILGIR
jgi:hypothetical protein